MALIKNEGNFLGVNYDLAIYENIIKDERVFNLFPKKRYYEDSGVEVFSEDIKEFDNKKIILEPETYNLEVAFPHISNIKTLVIFVKVIAQGEVYQPDFVLKLDSIDADKIYVREFLHLGLSDGLTKIYLSNHNAYRLEVNIFVAGDTTTTQFTPSNTYYKTDTNRIVNIQHGLGVIPTILCLNDDGTVFEDYTSVITINEATITFTEDFQGKIIFQHIYSYDCVSLDSISIEHDLNKYPGILLSDSTVYSVVYNDENNLTITFDSTFSGTIKLY
jgi:hypothetical protein